MKKRIPYFEVCISMLSYYLAISLMFNNDMFEDLSQLYEPLQALGSETMFVFVFAIAATTKIVGLLMNCYLLRKIGLGMSAFVYMVIAIAYAMSEVPLNWGTGIFSLLFIFSLLNIFDVKNTKLME